MYGLLKRVQEWAEEQKDVRPECRFIKGHRCDVWKHCLCSLNQYCRECFEEWMSK
jgi:hypothetical protein